MVDEPVPSDAGGLDDGFGIVENAEREEPLSEVKPDALDGIELGAIGRLDDEGYVFRDREGAGIMPAGAIEDHGDMDIPRQCGGEVGEKQFHDAGIDDGQHEGEVLAAFGVHDGVDIGPLVADLPRPPRAFTPSPPTMADPSLVADAGFVLGPELDMLVRMRRSNRLQAGAKPPFLKLSSASGSFFGWEGRIFWRENSRARNSRLIEVRE